MVTSNRKLGTVFAGLLLVAIGAGFVFGGFEAAAYEETILERETTETGTVTDTDVWQLPDGNWTYSIDFEYLHDQQAEIERLGIEHQYPGQMASEQQYANSHRGGKHDTRSGAESALESRLGEDPSTVTVYVDPFYPDEGSLDDASTAMPEFMQWGGAVVLFLGLVVLARPARRVSS